MSRFGVAVWAVLGCCAAIGAVKETGAMTRREARAAFEREWEPAFRGRTALPAELADEGLRDFTATGVVWTLALPVDRDCRLRFAKATFRDGAFASGTLHVMGLPEAKLSADDFAALRKDFPMLAACDRKDLPALLYYPTTKRGTMPVPEKQAIGLGFSPLEELYGGAFIEAIKRLHVSREKVRCRVDFTGPDGKTFVLGEVGISRTAERLEAKTILTSLGAARPDLISERELTEYYLKGSLAYDLARQDAKGVAVSATGVAERPTVTFYVSTDGDDAADGSAAHPVRTIPQAVKLTRSVLSDAKREIVVRDGLYPVLEPVEMDENDVDLTIRAEHSRQATLTGSIKLGGWRPDPEDARFLVADLPFEPEYGMGYALTSSGTNCPVACWPEKGRMKYTGVVDQTEIAYEETAFPSNFALGSIDLRSVWLELPQEWATTRTLIATNDVALRRFALKSKSNMSFKQFNHGFLMMNARVGLVKPGMWMYEAGRKRVVYWPREGERAETLDCRITATGTIFYLVKTPNVTIRGFVIEGCASSFTRNHPYKSKPVLGAVFVYWTRNTTIEDCEVRNSAANGIYAVKPHDLTIRKCHVHHLGSGGIDVYDGGEDVEIRGNDVHDYGLTAASATGVGMQAWGRCVGNHVHHGSGCGVVMWSVWSVLASNEIDHVMRKARDGGGLYGGQVYCKVHDNYVHDMWWPGLYNDEGGRDSVYFNNRFENCSWPIHMHATRRNVVSNNVFRSKKAMHLSFQGSGDCRFVDNKLYGPASMTNESIVAKYVANCAEWARNELFDLRKDGSYFSCGPVTLVAPAGKPGGPVILPRTVEKDGKATPPKIDGRWPGEYAIKWQKVRGFRFFADGRPAAGGQPSCNLRQCADDNYVYLHFHQLYARLGPYPGLINLNHVWGKGDGVKVYLGEKLEVTMFFDGTIESNDPTLAFGKDDFAAHSGGWYNGNGVEVRIPLKAIAGGRGRQVKFNAVNYNEATRDYTWIFPPKGDDVRTGCLEFPTEDLKVLK